MISGIWKYPIIKNYSYQQLTLYHIIFFLSKKIESFNPDFINILTEGPLGIMASIHCYMYNRRYTTMRCTRYELYVNEYLGYFIEKYLTMFRSFSSCCITPSPSLSKSLIT